MVSDELQRNLEAALKRIDRAARGRRVSVVAATKTVSSEVINAAVDLGITDVGENRVQEYLEKRDAVKAVKWHFIGTLQRNKVKYLVGDVALIQSVSGVELAQEIDRLAAKRGVIQSVLAEVNAADEPSKTGAKTDEIDALIECIRGLPNLRLKGLMAIPPIAAGDEVYKRLRGIYETYAGGEFDTLSVGMSGDYERAIEYGSNMVRLGTALFGARNLLKGGTLYDKR